MTGAGGPELLLVAAVARNGVIGRDGGMPWRLPSDLRRFRAATMGLPVIMGRATFESIGRPLDGRTNVVVTRDRAYRADGVTVVHDTDAALSAAREAAALTGAPSVAVIGGGTLYEAFLPAADRLLITHVDAEPDGDTRFPAIDPAVWTCVSREALPRGEKDSTDTVFAEYRRIAPSGRDRSPNR
jgi:dihydrofolate reductase